MKKRGEGKGRIFRRPHSRSLWIAYCGPRRDTEGRLSWGELRESARTEDIKDENKARAAAESLLRRRLREVSNDQEGIKTFHGRTGEKVTLADLLSALEQQYETHRKPSLATLRSSLKHVRRFFGSARAVDVSTASLHEYVAMRKKQGAANSTVNHETGAVGQAFSLAIESGTISFGPKIPKGLSEEESIREVRYTLEQADAVAAEFQKRGELDAFDFWTWMRVSGGMRPGAIVALEWSSLEREGDRWTLRLPASGDKNKYGRPIPLEGETREVIERRLKARRPGIPWIFHHRGRKLTVDYFRKFLLYPVLEDLKLPTGREGLILYDLKRTGMHEVRAAGVPEDRAMRLSGHRTAETYRRYAYGDEDDLREELRKADAYRARLRKLQSRTFSGLNSDSAESGSNVNLWKDGAPAAIRTRDLQLRRLTLYPD